MAIINTNLGGTDLSDNVPWTATNYNDTNDAMYERLGPVGSITAWLKTYTSVSSGTADTNTVDKLVDSGATFITDGVTAGMVIHNTTDDTFAIVSAVDSETSISLAADAQAGSSTTDVFPDGNENYVIYATPKLNEQWVECNGQTLSDADSPYNGATLPDLNGTDERFLYGDNASGNTKTENYMPSHTHNLLAFASPGGVEVTSSGSFRSGFIQASSAGTAWKGYSVVWIIRIK